MKMWVGKYLDIARLGANVVDIGPLKPWDDEVHPLRVHRLLHPGQAVKHDGAVTSLDCTPVKH